MNEKAQTLLDQYMSRLRPYETAQSTLRTKIESLEEYKQVQEMKSEFDDWVKKTIGIQPDAPMNIVDLINFVGKTT